MPIPNDLNYFSPALIFAGNHRTIKGEKRGENRITLLENIIARGWGSMYSGGKEVGGGGWLAGSYGKY
jgi:hypothetical protein